MDQRPLQPNTEEASLNTLGQWAAQFVEYGHNASNNIQGSIDSMTTQSWLRLIAVIGGYMLMRPYFMKAAAKRAVSQMEEEDEKEKERERQAQLSPNDLRGVRERIEKQHNNDDLGDGSSTDWGQKARIRQRVVVKQMLEAEERRREEMEDDKDIEEFLTQ